MSDQKNEERIIHLLEKILEELEWINENVHEIERAFKGIE